MTTTIDHTASGARASTDPAVDMLRDLLGNVQPKSMNDLLDLAGLVGEVDGGHITATTVVTQ